MDSTKTVCERLRIAKRRTVRRPRKGVIDRPTSIKPRLSKGKGKP